MSICMYGTADVCSLMRQTADTHETLQVIQPNIVWTNTFMDNIGHSH